jgi:hypothetical protein
MDFARFRNIESDTTMRRSIAGESELGPGPEEQR